MRCRQKSKKKKLINKIINLRRITRSTKNNNYNNNKT